MIHSKKLVFSKFCQVLGSFSLLFLSSYISYKAAYLLGEKYYFDKLFYKKSQDHGYIDQKVGEGNVLTLKNSPTIENRIKDMRFILNPANRNTRIDASNKKVFTIALIGDSFVYGQGVLQELRMGNVLEEKLNKIRPTRVYSLGIPGDNIFHNYTKYKLAKDSIQPDVYVFGMVENDLLIDDVDKYNDGQTYAEIKNLCPLPEFHLDNWWKLGNDVRKKAFYPPFLPQYSNSCYLKTILSDLDRNDNIIFFSFEYAGDKEPQIKDDDLDSYGEYMTYHYKKIVLDNGFPVLQPTLENSTPAIYETVSKTESHPSSNAHEQFADLLFKEITNNKKWRFQKE